MMNFSQLIKLRNLWQWLWITGSSEKDSYDLNPKHDRICIIYPYTCIYPTDCTYCPLKGIAWNEHCEDNDSISLRWVFSNTKKDRQYFAGRMVSAINIMLAKYYA